MRCCLPYILQLSIVAGSISLSQERFIQATVPLDSYISTLNECNDSFSAVIAFIVIDAKDADSLRLKSLTPWFFSLIDLFRERLSELQTVTPGGTGYNLYHKMLIKNYLELLEWSEDVKLAFAIGDRGELVNRMIDVSYSLKNLSTVYNAFIASIAAESNVDGEKGKFLELKDTGTLSVTNEYSSLIDIIGRASPRYYPEYYDFLKESSDWPESKYAYVLEGVSNLNTLSTTSGWTFSKVNNYINFIVEVKSIWRVGAENRSYGLMLRKSGDNYYTFVISANGQASFWKWYNRSWFKLRDWMILNKFNQRGENKLKVEAQGVEFKCYVNEEEAFTITDASIPSGQVGFYVDVAMHVSFDDFSIWDLSKIVEDLIKSGDELAEKGKWQDAEEKYQYAWAIDIGLFSTAQNKIASIYEKQGLHDAALSYYISSLTSSNAEQFYSACQKIVQIAKKLNSPPVLSKASLAFLDSAYKKIQKRDFEGANASYFAVLYNSAWYADAYYGLGKVNEYTAVHENQERLPSAIKNYELFLEAASADDHRVAEVKKKLGTLNEINQGLSQPREIQKVTYGSWPYGRSAFQISLEIRFSYRFSSNGVVQEKWEETYGKTYEAPSKFHVKGGMGGVIRVLPDVSVGGFWLIDNIGFGDFGKLSFGSESYGGLVRYALTADITRKGSYTEAYIDFGYGKTTFTADYRDVIDAFEGSSNIWLFSVGFDALIGNVFGIGASLKLFLSSVTEMKDTKTGQVFTTSAGKNIGADFSSVGLSLRFLFGL